EAGAPSGGAILGNDLLLGGAVNRHGPPSTRSGTQEKTRQGGYGFGHGDRAYEQSPSRVRAPATTTRSGGSRPVRGRCTSKAHVDITSLPQHRKWSARREGSPSHPRDRSSRQRSTSRRMATTSSSIESKRSWPRIRSVKSTLIRTPYRSRSSRSRA